MDDQVPRQFLADRKFQVYFDRVCCQCGEAEFVGCVCGHMDVVSCSHGCTKKNKEGEVLAFSDGKLCPNGLWKKELVRLLSEVAIQFSEVRSIQSQFIQELERQSAFINADTFSGTKFKETYEEQIRSMTVLLQTALESHTNESSPLGRAMRDLKDFTKFLREEGVETERVYRWSDILHVRARFSKLTRARTVLPKAKP